MTPYDDLPLGQLPDAVLADLLGVSREAVSRARKRRGIAVYVEHPGERRPHWRELVGLAPAVVVARMCRVPLARVKAAEPLEALPPEPKP